MAATAAALVAVGLSTAAGSAAGAEPAGPADPAAWRSMVGAQPGAGAGSALPTQVIESGGPLTLIETTPDLNCAVQHIDDDLPAFFEYFGCGTLAAAGERLYGPQFIPGSDLGRIVTPWDPQGEHIFSGSGTSSDPYAITSEVDVGFLRVTQIDTYVVGEESYTTDIIVIAVEESELETTVYRAGDCQLAGSVEGLGSHTPETGAVSCHAPSDAGTIQAGGRVLQFVPLTPGSNYFYGSPGRVWGLISTQRPLPDTVLGGDAIADNAIALSWTFVATPEPTVLSLRTSFARTDTPALPTQLSLSTNAPGVGEDVQVTAAIENPSGSTQDIDPLTVTLPPGVSYVDGSASSIGEPTVTGPILDFGTVTLAAGAAFEFVFAVNATSAGSGAIELSGVTRSGASVSPATGPIDVRDVPAPIIDPTAESGEIDPRLIVAAAGGAVLLIIALAASIAIIGSPRRVQRKLVREHVGLVPLQATTIHHTSTPDRPAPKPPTFRLAGGDGVWEHRVIEEES